MRHNRSAVTSYDGEGDRSDQVARGRSGFDQAVFNNVRAKITPPSDQPALRRFSDEVVWPNFRFGPKPGAPYPDEQFPVAFVDELAKQSLPDMNSGPPTPNPTFAALSVLATELKGAVLMGHSQSGSFPLEVALIGPTAANLRGLSGCPPGRGPSTGARPSSPASRRRAATRRCSTRRPSASAATAT